MSSIVVDGSDVDLWAAIEYKKALCEFLFRYDRCDQGTGTLSWVKLIP